MIGLWLTFFAIYVMSVYIGIHIYQDTEPKYRLQVGIMILFPMLNTLLAIVWIAKHVD